MRRLFVSAVFIMIAAAPLFAQPPARALTNVVTKGNVVDKPDLTKVDEIGFADLMPGSGHGPGGWSDVAAIEVYGKPVKR